jgi:hypothetical protein
MQIQEVQARLMIMDLYARYSHAVDNADTDAFAECFTDDGFTDISSFGLIDERRAMGASYIDKDGRVRGRDNLRRLVAREPSDPRFHHCTMNVYLMEIGEDSAKGTAYFMVLSPEGDVFQFGKYLDDLRFDDGAWRFAERLDIAYFSRGSAALYKSGNG